MHHFINRSFVFRKECQLDFHFKPVLSNVSPDKPKLWLPYLLPLSLQSDSCKSEASRNGFRIYLFEWVSFPIFSSQTKVSPMCFGFQSHLLCLYMLVCRRNLVRLFAGPHLAQIQVHTIKRKWSAFPIHCKSHSTVVIVRICWYAVHSVSYSVFIMAFAMRRQNQNVWLLYHG